MTEQSARDRGWASILVFVYVWLMVGFFTGTAVLIGPVQWITRGLQGAGAGQSTEDWVLRGVIALYVVGSFVLARWLVRKVARSGRRRVRMGIPAAVTVAALACVWAWMNPGRMLASVAGGGEEMQSVATASGAEFLFGAYPDRTKLRELQAQGVTAVISLQHPAVPIEVPGIAEERRAAQEMGIQFIHAPMLPWVSDNRSSVELLEEIARAGTGTYYVHCGLGRDRANVARAIIERAGGRTVAGQQLERPRTFAKRAAEGRPMERGMMLELAPDVWLVPHPNEHEFYGNMLAGQVAHVLSTLDPADPQQARWIEETRALLGEYRVPVTFEAVPEGDAAAAARAAALIRSLPRPLVVIVPETDREAPRESGGAAGTLLEAYYGGR